MRVGRHLPGAAWPLRPWLERGDSLLILGAPGTGKTALLRDATHKYTSARRGWRSTVLWMRSWRAVMRVPAGILQWMSRVRSAGSAMASPIGAIS
jgi:ATPase subunit of ABC transporter with duplicated ATPase domains